MWPAGTLCITIAANIAETGILDFPACFPDSIVGFVADSSICNVRFVEYLFRGIRDQIQFEASEGGTVQDNINVATLDRLRIPIPEKRVQDALAEALGVLDDKIALNRRMNQTLESMARAIFRSWFVDFDPVVAKAAGRQPFGMSADVAARFSSHFADSDVGPLPQGWGVSDIGREFSVVMGQSPPGHTYKAEANGLPFYQGRTDFELRYPKLRMFCTAPTRFAEAGDTLISVRAPVGGLNIALLRCCSGAIRRLAAGGVTPT